MFSFIFRKGPVTAKDIMKEHGVDASTVSRNVRHLIEEGFINVVGETKSGPFGGRKAKIFDVNPKKFHILGIGIEKGEIAASLINPKGKVIDEFHEVKEIKKDGIKDEVLRILDGFRSRFQDIVGVTVALPGIVDDESGVLIYNDVFGMRKMNLRDEIEKKGRVKVMLMNDANAAAADFSTEWKHLIYILVSIPFNLKDAVGVGMGIWINEKLYTGANMAAGEFKRNSFPPIFKNGELETIEDINKIGGLKYRKVKRFYDHFIKKIEEVLYILDPGSVVIGGDTDLFSESLRERMKKDLEKIVKEKPMSKMEIVIDTRGLKTVAAGGAKAFLKRIVDDYKFAIEVLGEGEEIDR